VDWGDGNTCNGITGPWQFCFTLRVNESIDTITNPELSVGFFTFADGEVGTWFDGMSSCKNDMPVRQFFAYCAEPGPAPDAAFTFDVDEFGTAHFTNTSLGGITYHWNFGDGSFSNLVHPEHTYVQNGTYTVTLIAYADCSSDTTVVEINVIITATQSTPAFRSLNIYPNPNTGQFILEVEGHTGHLAVVVRDLLGKTVMTKPVVLNPTGRQEMTLPDVAPGLYLVTVISGGLEQTVKMLCH
jgi:hypothetical protein